MKNLNTAALVVSVVLVLHSTVASAQISQAETAAARAAMVAIHPEAIAAQMRFLSSRPLAGRGTGTEGYQIAALYVASEMEALGLEPAGVNGTWFQPVPLRKFQVVPAETSFELTRAGKSETLKFGEDFVTGGEATSTDARAEAPLVFTGFGVTAPELKYDDYAGLDARGKIVVCLYGAPATFPSTERAYFSDFLTKGQTAVAHGAAGMIFVLPPEEQKRLAWNWIVPQIASGGMRWLQPDGSPHHVFPQLMGPVLMSQHGAEMIFGGASTPLEQVFADARAGKVHPFPLPGTARLHIVSRHEEVRSPNVIGVLTGSDPALRSQYVVYTAHLDHLGICSPVNGDDVCHGAYDNASGTATELEIARAFTALRQPPRRSVLFVFVTGEEKGLLGSDYFAGNPTVPLEAIAADVNIDGAPGLLYPLRDIVALGAEHSSLGEDVSAAARQMGYEVSPDPMPEQVFFIRSDQYSFVRQGVPAVAISDGLKSADPKMNGERITTSWLTSIYHTPKDDMDQPFDFASAAKGARLNFLVGYEIAQQSRRPTWNAGDFFGTKFARTKR